MNCTRACWRCCGTLKVSDHILTALAKSFADLRDRVTALAREPGPAGKDGAPGATGPAGKDGESGPSGPEGRAGVAGADGRPGRDGKDGRPGATGPTGPAGKDGAPGPMGPMPKHEWRGTELRFQKDPDTWGRWVDLRGPSGSGAVAVVHAADPTPPAATWVQRTAGSSLSALRAVYELDGAVHALSADDALHVDLLLGITLTAAQAGDPVNVQRLGAIEDDSWNWVPGRVYLGAEGALTQTPPTSGFDLLIGAATSATRITLNLQDPISLE